MDDDIRRRVLQDGRQMTLELLGNSEPAAPPTRSRQPAKLVKLAAEALSSEAFGDVAYLYSGFAMTSLPHRRPPDEFGTWIRRSGRFSLMVEPGYILDSRKMESIKVGLPYGSRARLILLYLQTEAIRRQSRVIELGGNLRQWLCRLGVADSGINYKSVRDQSQRLSTCRLTVGWAADDGSHGFQRASIVNGLVLIPPPQDARQGTLWTETATLSSEFFDALTAHPVPVTELAIRQLQSSSLSMDIYVWLAYRLHSLSKQILAPWSALHQQFGADCAALRHFKENFIVNLREAVAAYPDAKIDVGNAGVTLFPSPPPVPRHALGSLGRFKSIS